MAEEVDPIVNNDTNDTVGLSGRDAATSEGLLLAYGSLLIISLAWLDRFFFFLIFSPPQISKRKKSGLATPDYLIMALIPIYWGARRSVHFHDNLKVNALYY